MKAIFRDRFGSADVLEFRDLDTPKIGDGEVLVRVHAAGVNPGDCLELKGLPYAARLMGYGLRKPKNQVLGTDVAGRVESVGKKVTRFRPGDEVFGWCDGAFAEYASTPESTLARKPAHLAFEQAAAVPTAAFAALQGLRDVGRIQPQHHVLVVGASGGVGTFAVQIAKALGAEVTGVSSTRNLDLVRSTGADRVIDYSREDFTRNGPHYDLIVDLVGGQPLSSSRRALKRNGTYVVVGGQNAHSITGMERFAKALLISPFVRQRLRPLFSKRSQEDLEVLREFLDAGKVLPVIDGIYDLPDLPEALRYVEAGHARGKVVISI